MSFLQTQSGNYHGLGKQAQYRRAVSSAKREDGNSAINAMTESTLLDALATKVLVVCPHNRCLQEAHVNKVIQRKRNTDMQAEQAPGMRGWAASQVSIM
jgi:hypothetical protein